MSNRNCCITKCKNRSSKINKEDRKNFHLYSLPSENIPWKAEQRKKWIAAIIKLNHLPKDWVPSKNTFICNSHFDGGKAVNNHTHPGYIPSMLNETSEKSKVIAIKAVQRFKRRMERTKKKSTSGNVNVNFISKNTLEKSNIECHSSEELSIDMCLSDVNQRSVTCTNDVACGTEDLESDFDRGEMNYILCNMRTENTICNAEVQVSLHFKKTNEPQKKDNVDSSNTSSGFQGVSSIKTNDGMIDLAGVSHSVFALLLSRLPKNNKSKQSTDNRLLMFLMKMKLGLTYSALGILFNLHRTTVSRIFVDILQCLSISLKNCLFWPSKEAVRNTLPLAFKADYSNCRAIIDCTEVKIETPSKVEEAVLYYSNYKSCHTIKFLVACTPNGFISFVSKCYGGRSSDSFITNDCGFVDKIEPGDVILADKGFPRIKAEVEGKNGIFVMPPFAHNSQFTPAEVVETYKIARVRIHIERIMQRIKLFNILHFINLELLPNVDNIVYICCALVNLQQPILK